MRADVFWRTWNRVAERRRTYVVQLVVAEDATLEDILAAAHGAGLGRGTHQTGIVEVQTDRGIYARADGNRIDLSTPARAARVQFRSWDELEAEELAARAAA